MCRVINLDGLCERLQIQKSYYYRNTKLFDAAKLRLYGRPLKPVKFDLDVIEQILTTSHETGRSKIVAFGSYHGKRKEG